MSDKLRLSPATLYVYLIKSEELRLMVNSRCSEVSVAVHRTNTGYPEDPGLDKSLEAVFSFGFE